MRLRVSVLFLLLGLLVVSCNNAATPPARPAGSRAGAGPATAFPMTITDDAGRRVVIRKIPGRIVSIAPSNTEILFALGLGPRVVAVDQFSDYPPEARRKPRLGSYIRPDLEQIMVASPDLVLATGAHVRGILPALEARGLSVVVIEPEKLDEVFGGIGLVGRVTGQDARAADLVRALRKRATTVAARVRGAPRPRVFFELSPQLHTAGPGTFVSDLIGRAGGRNIAGDANVEWPQLNQEALFLKDPEVLLLADGTPAGAVRSRPGWQRISAVKRGRMVAVDADLVTRPGPRVVDGLEAIARALHPARFR